MRQRLSILLAILFVLIGIMSTRSTFAIPGGGIGCDVDFDGDCDNYDGMELLNHMGGTLEADPGGNGTTVDFGDFNAFVANYGEIFGAAVTTGDLAAVVTVGDPLGNFSYQPGAAELLYDWRTGSVAIDASAAPGGVISGFLLAGGFLPADEVALLNPGTTEHGGIDMPYDASSAPTAPAVDYESGVITRETADGKIAEISQTSLETGGFGSTPSYYHELGVILPTGLTHEDLTSQFANDGTIGAYYVGDFNVGTPGQRIFSFEWRVIGPPPGDYNLDGTVNIADYTVWRDNLGATGLDSFTGADGTGDGAVTTDDYLVWKSNFYAGATVPATADPFSAIPEPHTCVLILLGLAVLGVRYRTTL